MSDTIVRGITEDKYIRFFIVDSTDLTKKAVEMHHLSMTNTVLFGRILNAALMLGADLKGENESITVKVKGDGPSGGAVATANAKGEVKGYVYNPEVELPLTELRKDFNVKEALGKGMLSVIKDLGMKTPHTGQVELIYGTVAQDLTYYFAKSDQIPSSVGLGVLINPDGTVQRSGGFIIQLMPDTPEDVIVKLENNLAVFPNLTDVMDMGYSIKKIISEMILKGFGVKYTDEITAQFKCGCSESKMKQSLKLLPKEDLEDIYNTQETVEVKCQYCNTAYIFKKDIVEKILDQKS
ncbi:MAG: Hsp33 family molecular chaperone HslO [Candidatus Delongbacteria bacterium]|jgi:molecular chaperone Hsp33|nr:Hsp33 family molecular chaperone HslO [Candidatus Delongbacteria bacterium]